MLNYFLTFINLEKDSLYYSYLFLNRNAFYDTEISNFK